MSNRFRLDSHKLQYHPARVADFLEGRMVWPLYVEISPTSVCNHRCLFCNFNYLGHDARRLPPGRMLTLVDELHAAEVRALVLAGAGEPTIHPDCFPAACRAKELGLDVAMSTNGTILTPEHLEVMAACLTWVRFSMSGGTPDTYAAVHQTQPRDFTKVLGNLERLAELKRATGSDITIGSQCVLTEENHTELPALAKLMKARGADYFVVKHFYPHGENVYCPDLSFRTQIYLDELERLAEELTDGDFTMIARDTDNLERSRPYHACHGLPFIVYIREDGKLYTCFSHQEDSTTILGDLLADDFGTVWRGPGKDATLDYINSSIDKNLCQANCRHHQINLWLHQLKNPPPHVNFI